MTIPNVARRAMVIGIVAVAFVSACGGNNGGPSVPSGELTVTSIVPDSGIGSLTTQVQIHGTGFTSGIIVRVGGDAIQANVLSSTLIAGVLSPHPAGTVAVELSRGLGTSVAVPGGFTYLPAMDSLSISGNLLLASVGDRSQMTATARFVDGSTRNVTATARWGVTDSSIAAIAPDGLLTALSLGATTVFASYPNINNAGSQTRFASAVLNVTPPGTFAVSGRTREPGAGDLSGVRVTNPASARFVMSVNGSYTMAGLTDDRLVFTRDGYEPVEIRASRNAADDVPMQRVLRVEVGGASASSRIAPNDTSYDVGGGARCDPCKLVRITGGTGTVTVRLTWTAPSRVLSMWINGVRIAASAGSQQLVAPISAGAEIIIYVGSTDGLGFSEHIPFAISAG